MAMSIYLLREADPTCWPKTTDDPGCLPSADWPGCA
jgi:hypothetical protein